MKKRLIYSAIIALVTASAAYGAPPLKPLIAGGVDIRAVDWSTLCPSIKPVSVTRAGVTCNTVHPTSIVLQTWQDLANTGGPAPAPDCEFQAQLFSRLTRPNTGIDPWGGCQESFMRTLNNREGTRIKYDDMSLEQFRQQYFPASAYKKKGE